MNNKFYEKIGEEIQNARKNKNLSQQTLADKLNLSRSCIANWEQGKRQITFDDVYSLCKVLDLDIVELTKIAKKYL